MHLFFIFLTFILITEMNSREVEKAQELIQVLSTVIAPSSHRSDSNGVDWYDCGEPGPSLVPTRMSSFRGM